MKKIAIAASIVALAGCASKPAGPVAESASATPVSVATIRISAVDRPVVYEATGVVKARFNAILSSKVTARVAAVTVREGDVVARGQSLVALDSRELQAGVQIARANLSASGVAVDSARTSRQMEERTSAARIAQAEAAVLQTRAALGAAQSKLDLAVAGPRKQERAQADLAVAQAESSLRLAKTQLDRIAGLVQAGAMPKARLDEALNAYDLAVAQRDTTIQTQRISQEGSRSEDLRTAREGVAQARAAVTQSDANLAQARASALQAKVRAEEIRAAQAQVSQSSAALRSAEVSLDYATVAAPFDGQVVKRSVDPGAMATPGSPLLVLEGGDLRLEALVPETVLPRLRPGMSVQIGIDALGRRLSGVVDEIVPQGDAASHTFLVKLSLSAPGGVRSGMFGRALIETGRARAIEIPDAAVWEREGLHYVYAVNASGVARLRIVTVGERVGGRVLILSGLAPGDRIVAGEHERVSDGAKVASR